MKKLPRLVTVPAFLCLLAASAVGAATYYVSPTGSDDNTGDSPAAAWQTIARSVRAVAPGDTVLLADGVYREMVRCDGIARGEAPVTFRAQNPRQVIIDPQGATYCFGADGEAMENLHLVGLKLQKAAMGLAFEHGGTGLVFSNCEIVGCKEGIRVNSGALLSILDCSLHDNRNGLLVGRKDVSGVAGVLIERCTSGANSSGNHDGFVVEGMSTDVVFRDCEAFGAGDSGFDIKPAKTLLERCRSHSNGGWGFKLWGAGVKLINCLTYGNRVGGMGCAGDNLQFWNCTLGPDGPSGLRLETQHSDSCVIRNSIFYGCVLHCYGRDLPNEDYNCYYSPAGGDVVQTAERGYEMGDIVNRTARFGAHDLAADPLFQDPQQGDFRLPKGSPCAGCGLFSNLISVDCYGTPRGDPPDLGAIAAR